MNYSRVFACQGYICSHLKVTPALTDIWQASDTKASQETFSINTCLNSYLMCTGIDGKSVSYCWVRGSWLNSNSVTHTYTPTHRVCVCGWVHTCVHVCACVRAYVHKANLVACCGVCYQLWCILYVIFHGTKQPELEQTRVWNILRIIKLWKSWFLCYV